MTSVRRIAVVFVIAGLAGCGAETNPGGPVSEDLKPEDASELEGSNLGTAQAAHTQHYVDGTNQWQETNYPMGTDNPNCKDWWVYDRYLSRAPAVGDTIYTTYQSGHAFATGAYVDQMLAAIPTSLGYDVNALRDHNTEVARGGTKSGKCTGRYVFQWDNHTSGNTNDFLSNSYYLYTYIPTNLIPGQTSTACNSRDANNIPYSWIDLYVCEGPAGGDVGSISGYCAVNSGHWRKAGGSSATGYYNSFYHRCDVTSLVIYNAPAGKAAVSFNMVVKTGIGHAVAPATIDIYRVN
jgi:hypothetical protein